ncbi:hypothetical protein K9M79_01925 [Candidatus Woesearchaeota archaeon]|nr:hypothetical protein [Candidatus Woesearchaeota archaeon]
MKNFKPHRIVYLLSVIVATLALMGFVSATNIHSPKIPVGIRTGENITISVQNYSGLNNPVLMFKGINEDAWKNVSINLSSNIYSGIIPWYSNNQQGIIEYYFSDPSGRFPNNGSLKLATSVGDASFKEKGDNFLSLDSTNSFFCQPVNQQTFSCQFETFQGMQIIGYSSSYLLTANMSHLNSSDIFAEYDIDYDHGSGSGNTGEATCNHVHGDYNCSSQVALGHGNISGARRQASMIFSMWYIYGIENNNTFREIAINYTNGSADVCDVWTEDFDCNNNSEQGMMALAYWKAYEQSGDDVYRTIAINLSEPLLDANYSEYVMMGLWKAYEISGNSIYLDRAVTLANLNLDKCISGECSVLEHGLNIIGYWMAYEQTGSDDYYKAAYRKATADNSGSCSPVRRTGCDNPEEQGVMAWAQYMSFRNIKNISNIYAPRINGIPSFDNLLNVTIKTNSPDISPVLYFKKLSDNNWQNVNFNDGSAVIPNESFLRRGTYEYYIEENGNRFPGNGSIKFVVGYPNESLRTKAVEMTGVDSQSYCSPITTGDFSCTYEFYQPWPVMGYSYSSMLSGNISCYNLSNLVGISEIDDSFVSSTDMNGWYSTCDHANGDFNCNEINRNWPSGEAYQRKGGIRQASLIYGLAKSYSNGQNESLLRLAQSYAFGYASDCNVWEAEINCSDQTSLGLMLAAYWEIYINTGDYRLFDIANKLGSISLNSTNLYAGIGLFNAYDYSGNLTYFDAAINITNNSACVNCPNPLDHALSIILYWMAYEHLGYPDYYQLALNATYFLRDDSSCNPMNSSYSCQNPENQGFMTSALWEAYANYYEYVGNETRVEIIGQNNATISTEFNLSCNITNIEDHPVYNVSVFVNYSATFNMTGNETYNFYKLDTNESLILNWTMMSHFSGAHEFNCSVFSSESELKTSNLSIYINEVNPINISLFTPFIIDINATEDLILSVRNKVSQSISNISINATFLGLINISSVNISEYSDYNVSFSNDSLNIFIEELKPLRTVNVTWQALGVDSGLVNMSVNVSATDILVNDTGFFWVRYREVELTTGHNSQLRVGQNATIELPIYLQNTHNYSLHNVTVTIVNPGGAKLLNISAYNDNSSNITISANNKTIVYLDIAADSSKSFSWYLNSTGERSQNSTITATSEKGTGTSEIFDLYIAYCGDGTCDSSENYGGCPIDCPLQIPRRSGGSSGGSYSYVVENDSDENQTDIKLNVTDNETIDEAKDNFSDNGTNVTEFVPETQNTPEIPTESNITTEPDEEHPRWTGFFSSVEELLKYLALAMLTIPLILVSKYVLRMKSHDIKGKEQELYMVLKKAEKLLNESHRNLAKNEFYKAELLYKRIKTIDKHNMLAGSVVENLYLDIEAKIGGKRHHTKHHKHP